MGGRRGKVRVGTLVTCSVIVVCTLRVVCAPAEAHAAAQPKPSIAAAERCDTCHAGVEIGGHPIALAPRDATIPASWPLDDAGRLGCHTCHERCGREVPGAEVLGRVRGLRGSASGTAFCVECHDGMGVFGDDRLLDSATGGHAALIGRVHPAADSRAIGALDGTTRRCLACHDGTVASAAEYPIAGAPTIGERDRSHPIGITYPPRRGRGPDDYAQPAGLHPRMALPGGRVGCLACHDLYSRQDDLLVMSNRMSRLCLTCHLK